MRAIGLVARLPLGLASAPPDVEIDCGRIRLRSGSSVAAQRNCIADAHPSKGSTNGARLSPQ